MFEFVKEVSSQHQSVSSISACIFLTFSYVASLYVWKSNLSRSHPTTIKKRFFSVSCMMLLAPFVTQYFLSEDSLKRKDLYTHLGIRTPGVIAASTIPLLLTAILFLGPLTMQVLSGTWKIYLEPVYWLSSWQDLVWVRNHIMAPLSEEWVFRSCMMPLLLQCLESTTAVFLGPFLFGIAHFHHIHEQIKAGHEFKSAVLISTFQFSYTTIFGAYSSYLFVRTGHFVAPLLAHMFCNHMGFPNFEEIREYPTLQRVVISFNFILGFVLWYMLLNPWTSPSLYSNDIAT